MTVCPKAVPDITASVTSQGDLGCPEVSGDTLGSEKVASFLPQEISGPLKPAEVQLGSEEVQNALLPLKKSKAAKRLQTSPSSPEVCSAACLAGQVTASALTESMGATTILKKRWESTITIRADLSKMHQSSAAISVGDESQEMRMAQDGGQVKGPAETQEPPTQTPETPLCSEEELLHPESTKLEEPRERRASETAPAVGEEGKEPRAWKRRLSLREGKKQPQYPEDLGCTREEMDVPHIWAIHPSQQEGKGDNQSSEEGASNLSASDVLLATIADLKNTTTADATNAAASKLMTILEDHRSSLKDKVVEIVGDLCSQIYSIPEGQARRVALNVMASLAEEYTGDVVSGLLRHSLPCDSNITSVWRSLSSILEINTAVLWNILRELQRRPRFHSADDRAGLAPLAAVRALAEMLETPSCTMAMRGFYSQVFVALVTHMHFLVRLPEYTDASRDTPFIAEHVRCSEETMKTLLDQDGNHSAVLWMDKVGGWELLSSPEHHLEGILLLARALELHARPHVTGLLGVIIPKLCAEDEERTLTARALFAGLIGSKSAKGLLPRKNILAKLEDWQADPRPTVRWLSVHGFGSMALHRQKVKQLKALASRILLAFNEMDERILKEAVKALGKLLSCHQERVCLSSTCVRIAEHLCPLLRDGRDQVRAAAIGLFGKLLLRLRRKHKSRMRDIIFSHLVSFILHLQGSSQDIMECCEWTLTRCNNFLGWRLLEEIEVFAHYDSQEALSLICKSLVNRYPDRVGTFLNDTIEHLQSPEAPLRRAAIVLAGFLVFYLDARTVSKDVMASLLCRLVDLEHDLEPSISSAATVSLVQVMQACSRTATCALFRALRKVFCCISSMDQQKPLFEDSPFKKKRSVGTFEEEYF